MKKIYDYTIIGAGLTGLVSSLLLKKQSPKKEVLILEKNNFIGGISISEKLNHYNFDSIYMFPDIKKYLDFLEIDFEFYKYQNAFYKIKLINNDNKDFEIDLPPDFNKFKNLLVSTFPQDEKNILKFIDFCSKIDFQFQNMKSIIDLEFIINIIFSPDLVSCMNLSFGELIRKFNFKDKNLIKIFECFAGIAQLPPNKLNCLIPVIALINLTKGSYRQAYDFNSLLDKIKSKIETLNIDLKLNNKAKKIEYIDNIYKITTVNDIYYSRKIINTIDTKIMFENIIDEDLLNDKLKNKISNLEMTLSVFIIRLLVRSSDLKKYCDIGQYLFYKGDNVFQILYDRAKLDNSTLDEDIYHFAVSTKNIEKDIYGIELLAVPVSYNYWKEILKCGKEKYEQEIKIWENFYLDKLEKYYENSIKQNIISKKSITPVEFGAKFGLYQGCAYDMAQTNNQAGLNRFGFKTPLKNFYHCKQVHGIYGAFFQSFIIADYLLQGKINKFRYRF